MTWRILPTSLQPRCQLQKPCSNWAYAPYESLFDLKITKAEK